MAQFFTKLESKVRPGVYQRYENVGTTSLAETVNGTVACVFQADWGPLNTVTAITSQQENEERFGDSFIVKEALNGGASKILAVRIGTGGTQGTITLKDNADTSVDAVVVTMKYPGTKAFSCTVRAVVGDPSQKEFVLYDEDGTTLESLPFSVNSAGTEDDNEVLSLIEAASKSNFVTMAKKTGYTGTAQVKEIAGASITAGTDPTVASTGNNAYAEYDTGLAKLERLSYDCIICDSNDANVHGKLIDHVDEVFQQGQMGFAVIGEASDVAYTARTSHAYGYNNYRVIYVASGWVDSDGNIFEGYKAAARIAGMVAANASTSSLTHAGGVIADAVEPSEWLTNAQIESALSSGMIVFTTSAAGKVWIESAITTLVNPEGEDDSGWKKVKRAKIRFEMMTRIANEVDPLIGTISNNSDGRATVIQVAQAVLNDMVGEGKLSSGAQITFDSAPTTDSAYFVIEADDMDSLEKIYLTYQYRFATE